MTQAPVPVSQTPLMHSSLASQPRHTPSPPHTGAVGDVQCAGPVHSTHAPVDELHIVRVPKRPEQSDALSQPTQVPVSLVSQTGRCGVVQSSLPSHAGADGSGMHVCAGPKLPLSSQTGRLPALLQVTSEVVPAVAHDSTVEQQKTGLSLVHAIDENESAAQTRIRTALHREVTTEA
jgi:hypothetical protein